MVSVIIPNYNREKLIVRAVESVLGQTYKELEVIVVDDCSTDFSIKLLDEIRDSRLKVVRLDVNSGACVARNRGISEAKGEYIAFLDSDDQWLPDKLEMQLNYMSNHKCDAVFSQYYYYELFKKESFVKIKPLIDKKENYLSRILYANCVAMDTLIAKKDVFNCVRFDPNLPRYQDWDIAIQIAELYKLDYLDKPTLNVYEQKNSITYSTSKEKKYNAIQYLYNKHLNVIQQYPEAQSHFLWTMGLYSFCTETPKPEFIKKSAELDNHSLKKKIVYLFAKLGGSKIIGRVYGKRH